MWPDWVYIYMYMDWKEKVCLTVGHCGHPLPQSQYWYPSTSIPGRKRRPKIAKFAPTTIPEFQAPTIYKNYTSYNLKFVNPTKKNVLPQLKLPGNLHYRKLIRPPLQKLYAPKKTEKFAPTTIANLEMWWLIGSAPDYGGSSPGFESGISHSVKLWGQAGPLCIL